MTTALLASACIVCPVEADAETLKKVRDGAWQEVIKWEPMAIPGATDDAIIQAPTSIGEDLIAGAATVNVESALGIGAKGTLNVGVPDAGGLRGTLRIGTIDAGGSVTVSGEDAVLRVGRASTFVTPICGISICVGALDRDGEVANVGRLEISDQGKVIVDAGPAFASSASTLVTLGSVLSISGSGSSFTTPGNVGVSGSLTAESSGSLSANNLSVADQGTAIFSASTSTVKGLDIGGTVIVRNGANLAVEAGATQVNLNSRGEQASLTVQGLLSTLSTRTLRTGGSPINPDAGKITVKDGGRIIVSASTFVGEGAAMVVEGGQTLFSDLRTDTGAGPYALLVGGAGSRFMVRDGGTAVVESLAIGTPAATSGASTPGLATVRVSGAGSTLRVSEVTDIGGRLRGHDGLLIVEDGGQAFSRNANIGQNKDAQSAPGSALVSGAGAQWTIEEALRIGPARTSTNPIPLTGTLTVAKGGLVSAQVAYLGDAIDTGGNTVAPVASINIGAAPGSAPVAPGSLNIATDLNIGKFGTINFNHDAVGYRFSTAVESVGAGDGALVHRNGTTILDGDLDRYTGTVTVHGGQLSIDTTIGSSQVAVNAGGRLGGRGSVAGTVTVQNNGTLFGGQGDSPLTMTTLDLKSGANVNVGIEALTPVPIFDVRGNLTLDGVLNINAPDQLGSGLYRVFNYGGGLTNNGLDIGTVSGSLDPARFSLFLGAPGQVNLLYAGASGVQNLIGNGNGTIQIGGGGWSDGAGNAAMLGTGDFVILSGAGMAIAVNDAGGAVDLGGFQFAGNGFALNGAPITLGSGFVPFRVGDGTGAGAAFTATINAPLTGNGGLQKTDLGTLVLTGANSYRGGTTISAGTLRVTGDGALGAPAGGVTINGGALSADALVSARSLSVGTAGGKLDVGAGGWNLSGTIGGMGTLHKVGGGTLAYAGNGSGFAGTLSIDAGRLALSGILGGTTVIGAGATLSGTGTVGNLDVFGTLSPGNSPGTLSVDGNLTLHVGSTYQVEIAGLSDFDQLAVEEGATLAGTLDVDLLGGFVPMADAVFDILFASSITGRFSLIDLPITPSGSWDVLYLDDRVRLAFDFNENGGGPNPVPAPSAAALLLAGLGGMALRRRRAA